MNKFPAVFFCRCRGSCFPILVKLVPLHKQLAIAGDLGHMLQSLTGHEAGNYTLGLTRMTWPRSSTSCLKVINGDPFPQRPVPLGHWDHRGKAHTHTHRRVPRGGHGPEIQILRGGHDSHLELCRIGSTYPWDSSRPPLQQWLG